uniref:Uncharacterized protein n=1 Tax=Ananas comosus var. bracteatus TaxID=296719 RepID=A0A6V7NM06_ANACO|nr:unnamed protein product [Ananas comosus var. bracteatus]
MMGNPIEVSKAVKFEENPISAGYSCDGEGFMGLATNLSDINKPGKKSKKNRKKKANLLKNHHLDANAASKSPALVNTHSSSIEGSDCEALMRAPDECKQFNSTISLKSSKEDSPMNFAKFDDSCNKEVKVTDPGLEFISPTGWDQMDSGIGKSGEFEAKPAVSSSCHDGSAILEIGSYAPSSYGTKRLNSTNASQISRDKHKQFRNKNTRFVWRKTGRKTGSAETCGINRSYLGDGLLPCPEFSYAFRNGPQHRAKELGISNGEVKQKSWGWADAVLTEQAFGHSFRAAFGQKLPIPVNGFCGKSNQRLDQPINVEKNICNNTDLWDCMSNLHRPPFRPYISGKGNLCASADQRSYIDGQRISHRNHHSSFDSSELYHFGFVPLAGRTHMQIYETVPMNKHVLGKALNISGDYSVKSLVPLETGHPYVLYSGDCFTDKIAPIHNRHSMLKASIHRKETKITGKRDAYEEKCFKDSKSDCCGSCFDQNSLSIGIFSEKATQALVAAYRLQIACENVQNATGSPIAEFEKVLCSASPVIVSSFDKRLNKDVVLRDVWSWYEGPGNYGLEVKAEDLSQTSEGLERKAISFRAYFVPLLSAVQLFDPVKPSCVDNSASANCLSDDSEVIFEYFEQEPPQNRKPLYSKWGTMFKSFYYGFVQKTY